MEKKYCFNTLDECRAAVIDKSYDIIINSLTNISLYSAFTSIIACINVFAFFGLIYCINKFGFNAPLSILIFCIVGIAELIISYYIRKKMLVDCSDTIKSISWSLFSLYSKYDELNEEERKEFFKKYIIDGLMQKF